MLTGEGISQQASPNTSGKFKAGHLDSVVIHYTAGSSAESSARSLCDPASKASAHLVIARNGNVIQLVPFDTVAWHAGKSAHMGREGMNQYSIGIEIDNAGPLEKHGNTYLSWFKRQYKEEDVVYAVHRNETAARYWHEYTEQQILKVQEICGLLAAAYGLKYILGHEEISPGRKTDPGPAFPLDRLRDRIFKGDRNEDGKPEPAPQTGTGVVNGNLLNIRNQPSTAGELVTRPLQKGTLVRVLEEKDGWCKVKVEVEGWVSKKYLTIN